MFGTVLPTIWFVGFLSGLYPERVRRIMEPLSRSSMITAPQSSLRSCGVPPRLSRISKESLGMSTVVPSASFYPMFGSAAPIAFFDSDSNCCPSNGFMSQVSPLSSSCVANCGLCGQSRMISAVSQHVTTPGKESEDPSAVRFIGSLPLSTLHFDYLNSTHKWCEQNINRLVDEYGLSSNRWIAVLAKHQMKSVGTRDVTTQRERYWHSTPENIAVTFAIPFPSDKMDLVFHFPQITSYAITRTLLRFGIRRHPKIKWVNDVLVGLKKISGVLVALPGVTIPTTSTVASPTQLDSLGTSCVLLSIGLNLFLSDSDIGAIDQPATSLYAELQTTANGCMDGATVRLRDRESALEVDGSAIETCSSSDASTMSTTSSLPSKDAVFDVLAGEIVNSINTLQTEGFTQFREYISEHLAFKGEEVVMDMDTHTFKGTVVGIGAKGELMLSTLDSGVVSLVTGRILKDRDRH
eukprot:GHVQ01012668.1.p1 GENE.GHVQ01012668.1~~GHVQ01012668.1.p1  ORF type:complete len:466 (-),score=43.84 GHVQ01012668.1:325-1722(-)